jgi:hypothetical protein
MKCFPPFDHFEPPSSLAKGCIPYRRVIRSTFWIGHERRHCFLKI